MARLVRSFVVGTLLLASSTTFADVTGPLDYAHLKQAIQSRSIESFDDLLKFFDKSPLFKTLLENPVLNERSKALHSDLVSATFPRIIMHGGNLTMMVLGDPRLDESQFLEIIEFLPSTRTFAFHVINFHAKGTDEEFVDDANTARFENFKDPTFKNVDNCLTCHQMEAHESRPRWMTGPLWQTPFGAVENVLHAGSRDFENWKLFQATYADSVLGARYRAVKLSRMKELDDGSLAFVDRPNQKLTNFLDRLNNQRVARVIEASPNFTKYAPAIVASFFSCGQMSKFLPATEIAGRETAVRTAITNASRSVYVRGRVKMDLLNPEALKSLQNPKNYWRFPKDDPTVIEIDDHEFLEFTDLSLEDILARTIRLTSDVSLVTGVAEDKLVKFLPIDLLGYIKDGVDFSKLSPTQVPLYLKTRNQKYYPALAKLRYLLEDSVEEKPIFWSISKSSPFGDSYDFGDGQGGFSEVLSNGLQQRFLADYPEFAHLFQDHISESDLCQKLKAAQRDALNK